MSDKMARFFRESLTDNYCLLDSRLPVSGLHPRCTQNQLEKDDLINLKVQRSISDKLNKL